MSAPETVADLERRPDDAMMAVLAHLSFVVGHIVMAGILLGLMQDRSEYVRFQVAQVFAVHVLFVAILVAYIVFFVGVIALSVFLFPSGPNAPPPWPIFAIFPLHFAFIFGMLGVNALLMVLGIVKTARMQDFTLPLVGGFVFRRWFYGRRR